MASRPEICSRIRDGLGVQAMTCFPSFPRFAGAVFAEGEDKELARLCSQAWNDFHLDEWAATAPDRFIPVAVVPFWDLDASVAEIYRVAEKDAKTVTFPDLPDKLGLPSVHSDHCDPLLSAVEETGMVLAQHFGSGGFPPPIAPDAPFAVFITLMGTMSMTAMTDWLFSNTLYRHPRLKIGLSEGGIGWIPYILERCDSVWRKHRFYNNIRSTRRVICSRSTSTVASSKTTSASRCATAWASIASPGNATTRTRTRSGPAAANVRPRHSRTCPTTGSGSV
ncbi:amidohydrolase family protein [Mycobacterium sp.]|uniref:amidohydrolase family protein n=1 Tax=Mycobacterium sp. TaxID=1785 RepID=UPI0039C9ED01